MRNSLIRLTLLLVTAMFVFAGCQPSQSAPRPTPQQEEPSSVDPDLVRELEQSLGVEAKRANSKPDSKTNSKPQAEVSKAKKTDNKTAKSDGAKVEVPAPKVRVAKKESAVWVDGPYGRKENILPTLERIARGEKHSHRNDGSTFYNRERRLPIKKRGYYKEYVHPTKGRSGPGAQRIVIGSGKETYYTPDHYNTFQQVEYDH